MGCCQPTPAPHDAPPAGCGKNVSAKQLARYAPTDKVKGQWWTTDRFAEVAPRLSGDSTGPSGRVPVTLDKVFERAAQMHPGKPALTVERKPDGTAPAGKDTDGYVTKVWTWRQYFDETCAAARGFLSLGLEDKGSVVVYGFNSPEWFMALQAAMMANGGVCGVYPTDKVDNVQYKARHTACNVAVVEGEKQLATVKAALAEEQGGGIPTLRAVVVWLPGKTDLSDIHIGDRTIRVLSWQQLVEQECGKKTDADLAAARAKIKPGGLSSYIYTSGTTGRPKAVMVSHDNIQYMTYCVEAIIPEIGSSGQERVISYLPLSHVAGLLMDIAVPTALTANGRGGYFTITFARPTDLSQMTLAARIGAVKPTLFLGVPRVWEKIRDTMIEKAKSRKLSAKDQARVDGAKERGREWARNQQLGGTGERPGGCLDQFIDGKVYEKVKTALGLQECRFALTGAAPIDTSCLEFFGQLGININEVYGMSECCGATTISSNRAHVWGSCGFAVPGGEVKIFKSGDHGDCSPERPKVEAKPYPSFSQHFLTKGAPVAEEYQGEVCFRGRHIMMGYLANPDLGPEHVAEIEKKTADAIDSDGWLHSGDKGAIDAVGMVKITGRFKEIIIPAGGENVSPIPVEECIKKDPTVSQLVSNVMMVGDKRKYCVAIVSLKVVGATGQEPGGNDLTAGARECIAAAGGTAKTVTEAMDDMKCIELITAAIVKANKDPSVVPNSAASIKAFTIIPVDFSETGGQLTATLKLKRAVVEAEHVSMVGSKDTVDGVDPGFTGALYKGPLQDVMGVKSCYARYL
eukprot:TRINITY_DN9256_c0_g1_i1.p1 TRINITY_DN9256_c0_g1~~TRINITY_DN9256_c0_g1_i1.p1  ORF type:complete len:802 (+),score=271.26 TRINITY_DN9256_c0_g1_i1:52-2457(+)